MSRSESQRRLPKATPPVRLKITTGSTPSTTRKRHHQDSVADETPVRQHQATRRRYSNRSRSRSPGLPQPMSRASDELRTRAPASEEISKEQSPSSHDPTSSPIDLLSEDSFDEETLDDMETVTFKIPKGRKDTYQGLRQLAEDHGGFVVHSTKRKYDTSKFRRSFKEGHAIHSKLMLVARSYFFIYLDIPDDVFPQLVKVATGHEEVHTFSNEYDAACTRLSEWRKNWWSRLMKEAKKMQWHIMSENSWKDLPSTALLKAYASKMNGDYIHQLFDKINSRTVNFHESLSRSPECRQVYRYLFPHLMKKIHEHCQNPIAYNQTILYQDIRGLGVKLAELNYSPQKIFVYWPRKGAVQPRESKSTRASDFSNDAEYAIPALSDDEATPVTKSTPIGVRCLNPAAISDTDGSEVALDE